MKTRVLLLIILAISAVPAGCDDQSGDAAFSVISTGPNGEILLVNPDSGSEDFEMEAAFEGTLALSDGNCIIGRTTQGQESMVVFPAETRFVGDDPLTLKVEGRSIEIGVSHDFRRRLPLGRAARKTLGERS